MISSQLRVFFVVVTLVMMVPAFAASEPLIFTDAEQEARFQQLTLELRCLVCQNQNLADSDAPLAQDLRKEIYNMMQDGRTNDEIKQFLIDRYGDFVLYMPPVKSNTLVLWLMPAILLFGGALVVLIVVRKRTLNPGGPEEENS
jgi:cytochrome c-type biogenesis protein CcmH